MGISRQQALDCLRSDDLIGMGMEADALRRQLHPEGVVTYRCVYDVDVADPIGSYPHAAGALRVHCSDLSKSPQVTEFCRSARSFSGEAWIEVCLSGSAVADSRVRDEIARWAACGINSITADTRKTIGDLNQAFAALLTLHRAAHALGMRTVVGIPFGGGEPFAVRLDLLDSVRQLQEETGGFVALVPQALDDPAGRELDSATSVERLKMLAVARMYVDSIPHIQSPQVGAGLKVLQTGLRFGADDTELRLPQRGVTEPELRRVIRDAGFLPVERDGAYATVFLS